METVFRIEKNESGHRILLIEDEFRVFKYAPINYDEFDAMMFLSEIGDLIEHQFLHLNPLIEYPFYLKPFFINPKATNASFLKCAADGLSIDINEPLVVNKIEEVKLQIKKLNIEIKDEKLKNGEAGILVSIFRFFLSRGGIPNPTLKKCSVLGYSICFYDFFLKHNLLSLQSIIMIYEEYFKNKYIKQIKVLDVVQYCKYCNHTHIIYTEICPKCDSCEVELNSMIHHYPCANVTAEISYMHEGDLICPKCQKHLHHIGVDYDRPAGIYNCDSCSASFSRSNMRGTCVTCEKVLTLDEFQAYKISSLEFTTLGMDKIAEWDIYKSNDQRSVSVGVLSVNSFVEYLRNEIEIQNLSANDNKLTTIRVLGIPMSKVGELSQFIFDNILNAKCTFKDNTIYITFIYTEESVVDGYAKSLDEHVAKLELKEYEGVDYTNYSSSIAIVDYLKQLF